MKVSPTDDKVKDTTDQQLEDSSTSDAQDIDNIEDSSNSETSEEEVSTFDLVKQAIDPEGEKDDAEDSSEEDDEAVEAEGDKEEKSEDEPEDKADNSDEPSEEELKAWKPKTKKRFESLQTKYREEKSLREKAENDAGQYRQFTSFLEENRLSGEEANKLFHIGALMKNDPVKALEAITPYYEELLQTTGNVLPAELQQQVDQGYLTKANALELSRRRATENTNKAIVQEKTQYQQQQDLTRQNQQFNSMQNALANWENQWSTSDPDYNTKKDRVLERVELALARASRTNSLPQTVEQITQLAENAKKEVETDIRQYRPKKSVKVVDGGTSSQTSPEPKDTQDVIRRALNK